MLTPIRLPICNAYLLQGQRPILIDSGRPKDVPRLEAALARHNLRLADLALILHTHAHWDHCGSSAELHRRSATPLAVHEADAERMRQGRNGPLKPTNLTAWILHWLLNGYYPPAEPTLRIAAERDLTEFGVDARIVHTPGHTPGSITVLTAEGDAIVGDLIMGGWWGGKLFRSRPGLHYFAEDVQEMYGSLRRLLTLNPKTIWPGHGGPLDPQAVGRWLDRRGG